MSIEPVQSGRLATGSCRACSPVGGGCRARRRRGPRRRRSRTPSARTRRRRASRRGTARSGSRCPTIPPTRRSPWPRSSSAKLASTIARLAGTSRAAATPCRTRAAISTSPLGASRAKQGGRGEPDQARDEHDPAPVEVAERSACDDQRAERQQVGVHHPLQATELEIEVATDRRQRNRDDARFQKRRARAEDHGGERPAPPRTRVTQRLDLRTASTGSGRTRIHDRPCSHSTTGAQA